MREQPSNFIRTSLRLGRTFIRAHVRILIGLAVLLTVYTLLGFLLVPKIIRSQLEQFAASALHRPISIGEIRFNPFKIDASISGLALTEADGSPLMSLRHFYVNAQLASVWRRAIVLHELELSAPQVHVKIAADGTVNLAQLVPETADNNDAGEPLAIRIGHLAVREGSVGIEDIARAFSSAIAPIRFTLTDFRTDPNHANAYQFAGRTVAGEALEWSGKFTVRPQLGSNGSFSVRGLRAATIDSYLGEQIPFRLANGTIGLQGRYEFALDPLDLKLMLPALSIRDLAIAERAAGDAVPVKLAAIELADTSFSLGAREVGVRSIAVDGAHVDVAREADGSINLLRLVKSSGASNSNSALAASTSADTSAAWTVRVDSIHVNAATLLAEDRGVTPTAKFALSPANLAVDGYDSRATQPLKVRSDVTVDGKGRIEVDGNVALQPLSGELTLGLSDLSLPSLQSYLSQATTLKLHSGTLASDGKLSFAPTESSLRIGFNGDVRMADLRATDQTTNEDFVKWRDLNVTGIDFDFNPNRLRIERIVARQPYGRVVIAQDTSANVSRIFKSSGDEPSKARSESSGASKPWPIAIGTVQVIDGSANFADFSVEPSFATGILGLNGAVSGLSSAPSSRARVALEGRVDRYAPVDINGQVNLLSAAKYTDIAMQFRNMELTTFNPYSGKFAGYNISKGKLSTELKYLVENRRLEAAHHIVLDNLEFGDKTDSKDAAPIPIKFAVALLKDRNGVIDVNLPVAGTLDDPTFRLGPVIWKAILGLLTKAATAPFAALGALFGGGEELAFVDFPAGSAELRSIERDKLATLAKALAERPQLRLDVPLTLLDSDDAKVIAEQRFAQRTAQIDASKDERQRLKAFEATYKAATNDAPAYPPELQKDDEGIAAKRIEWLHTAILQALAPSQAELDELARARAQAVQSALLTDSSIDPQRVFVTRDRKATRPSEGLVRMEMKLE